jgi:hypothetical protein
MFANEHQRPKRMPRKRRRLFGKSLSAFSSTFPSYFLNLISTSDMAMDHNNSLQQGYALSLIANLIRLILSSQLWAVMLRNSSELFVHQCTKSKFIDTLEDVLNSQRTSPVVRERLLDVLAAAAYASSGTSSKNEASFRVLWRKVKPAGKPDEVRSLLAACKS